MKGASMSQRTIRVVFSATPSRMGKFIRATTHSTYNHVSVSLRENGALYSFARKYCNVPFCGGFVKESPLRYRNGNRKAYVRICTIPVTEEQHHAVKSRLQRMLRQPDRYLYNLFSAAAAPLRQRIPLPASYTCVEFTVSLLRVADVLTEEEAGRFWSVDALQKRLSPFLSYEGPFPDIDRAAWLEDSFPRRRSKAAAVGLTAKAGGRLLLRFFRGTT